MNIKIFICNSIEENTIVLYDDSGEAAVIDCGCLSDTERRNFCDFITANNLKPVVLLNTHLHIDHIFGNGFMAKEYGLLAQAHRWDEWWLTEARSAATRMGIRGFKVPPPLGGHLDEGDVVRFGHSELTVIHVPGHSAGSICFYSEKDKLLISGDVLFEGCIGRSDLPEGNTRQLIRGIQDKLLVLPDDVRVIPGHGNTTTIEQERLYNQYLKM
jgi:glyoxylase-like metal-dependent hydrolase (beta-lactamase superfamily II)